jgi:hypothetical protein
MFDACRVHLLEVVARLDVDDLLEVTYDGAHINFHELL